MMYDQATSSIPKKIVLKQTKTTVASITAIQTVKSQLVMSMTRKTALNHTTKTTSTIWQISVMSLSWRTTISSSKGNSNELWKTLQGVLGEANGEVSDAHTTDDFATFFQNKVDSVRSSTATTSLYDVPCRATPTISEPVTAEEVERMIGSSPNKSCQLDPAPTRLVKDMRTLLSRHLSEA